MKHIFSVLPMVLVLAWPVVNAQLPEAEVQLKAAMNRELVDGDLTGAIERYKQIIAKYPKQRELVAKALLQLAGCYEKLGSRESRQAYQRIVRDFADISAVAAAAKAKLAALRTDDGTPFVHRTLDPILTYGAPDGRLAIFYKGDVSGRVYARDLSSGAERVLIDLDGIVSNFAWSSDSRQLAFDFQNTVQKVRETRILTVASGELRSLPRRHGYPLSWTASGDLLFYRPNYPANVMDMTLARSDTGEIRRQFAQPIPDGCCPIVTPDGARMVVPRAKRLMVIDVASGAEAFLTEGTAEEIRPVLSADGRLVAFASNRDGKWALYVAPVDRAPVRDPLMLGAVDQTAIAGRRGSRYDWWTAGGLLTVALSHTDTNIYRIAMNPGSGRSTGHPQRLTQEAPRNFSPTVSPDGIHIAYQYRSGSKAGIAVMDAAGVSEQPLIEQAGNLPVGWRSAEEILFYDFATRGGERPAITAVNIKTGLRSRFAQVEGLYWQYLPSRNEILHSHPGGGGARAGTRLMAWSLADGKDREVATVDYLVPFWVASPDGRRIAFSVARNPDSTSVQCELALMSIDGVREKTLMENSPLCGVGTAWSPDGRFLLVATASRGPHVVAVETAESWPLHSSTTDRLWEARGASWSPDGSFIVLSHSTERVERLAWEGVTYDAVAARMTSAKRRSRP